jgi:hypothetical protein
MTPALVSIIIVVYFPVLIGLLSNILKGAASTIFFTADRQSPRHLAAFGMTGSFFFISRTIGSAQRLCHAAFRQADGNQASLFQKHSLNLSNKFTV